MLFIEHREDQAGAISQEVVMEWFAAVLDETADFPHPETLDTFRASIDPRWIEEALAATGTATLRRRRLPASR